MPLYIKMPQINYTIITNGHSSIKGPIKQNIMTMREAGKAFWQERQMLFEPTHLGH